MAYRQEDEWIDLAQGKHVVVYRNADTGHEHHYINLFGVDACPTCGHGMMTQEGHALDFHQMKIDKLVELNDHHKKVSAYREKHPHVRLGTGPK